MADAQARRQLEAGPRTADACQLRFHCAIPRLTNSMHRAWIAAVLLLAATCKPLQARQLLAAPDAPVSHPAAVIDADSFRKVHTFEPACCLPPARHCPRQPRRPAHAANLLGSGP